MFENYIASAADLEAVEKGIWFVWNPKLSFIFKKRRLLEDIIILSYDCEFFYLWKHKNFKISSLKISKSKSTLPNYELFKLPHKLIITDDYQLGWVSGFALEKLISIDKLMLCFAEGLSKPWIISGSMVTPFIACQESKAKHFKMLNPYVTYESYLATIVHEFGHKYFDKYPTWRFSDKRKNLSYLRSAQNLYAGKKTKNSYQTIGIPNYDKRQMILTEIFAFCTDYSAASMFWESHQKDIDKANVVEIKKLIEEENNKNLFRENSVLDPDPYAHSAAMVIGKIIIESNPKMWPERIINSSNFRI